MLRRFAVGALVALVPFTAVVLAQLPSAEEHESIGYSNATPSDPVARLQKKIDSGEVKLEFDPAHGWLPSVLAALAIPASSQGLVFSRTSLQVDRIAPWTPRAIYFNDDLYVGWVQGGPIMEVASADPNLGGVFYTLDQQPSDHPKFHRQTQMCLQCHASSATGGVPGFIVRSVFADRYGYPVSAFGETATTDRTPLDDRWGGWYVTGTHGDQRHMGNIMAPVLVHEISNVKAQLEKVDFAANANIIDLKGRVNTKPYLAPTSDIVALLVITHQSYVHNLITNANFEARKALYDEQLAKQARGDDAQPVHLETTMIRIQSAAERLVRAMLFVKEAPLTSPIKGTSSFAADFERLGPRDSQGRSLRDLDLKQRLFKYPLSYLIYSDGFDALPSVVKDHVYRRLRQVLTGDDKSPEFAHLSDGDRLAILNILEETKPDFAAVSTK
jgi:hypothetical protein